MDMNINAYYQGIALISLIITAIVFFFSRIRKQDMQILRDANTDLRDSIDDKTKQISHLEESVAVLQKQVKDLTLTVKDVQDKNANLGTLVREALVLYFKSNPTIASALQQNL